MKVRKINKIFRWLFEEDKAEEEQQKSDKEIIEINFFQAMMIAIVTLVFLFWLFFSHFHVFSRSRGFNYKRDVLLKIEKNYFINDNTLQNGSFSQGLQHWVTSDGGAVFPLSKSRASLEKKDFHSKPYSMKIESIYPANRYHYSKKKRRYIIDNAYTLKSQKQLSANSYLNQTEHWLGVLPGVHVQAEMWYKGDIVSLSVLCFNENGSWSKIAYVTGRATDKWTNIKAEGKVPQTGRAIAIEITINQAKNMPSPVVLIDDVIINVEEKK